MARLPKPFIVRKRNDSKTYQVSLNPSCGLPHRVCLEWTRRSFRDFPDDLAGHRSPKTKAAAEAAALALIRRLASKMAEGSAKRATPEDVTVGDWIEKFTRIETSPRTGVNASKNRPYSSDTVDTYRSYFAAHIAGDAFCSLKMAEIDEEDALEFVTRLSVKKLANGRPMSGSRTFAGAVTFVRMAFRAYARKNGAWGNPFQNIDPPIVNGGRRGFLPEGEMLRLFGPGVLQSAMELAVCAAMFLSGLRRAEIFALKPDCLDWNAPKITVKNAWQNFDSSKKRTLGPTKGKRERDAPFDPVLQGAIKRLWAENGRHEFVFSWGNGSTPGPAWIHFNFPRWLRRAGIETGGRKIVPHSARHSLASLLEEKGVQLRYIQDLLGHSDLKTTKGYLHSTEATIRNIGSKISDAMAGKDGLERGTPGGPDKQSASHGAAN